MTRITLKPSLARAAAAQAGTGSAGNPRTDMTVKLPSVTPGATMMQKLKYQPVMQEEEKWYKGDVPTASETVARIYTTTRNDPARGQQLFDTFEAAAADPSSPWYSPYTQATNQAVGKLAELGVDVSGGIDDAWFERNAYAMTAYRTGTGSTPLAPSSSSTTANDIGYWYYKLTEAEDVTKRAETEWAALQEELTYWAGRTDRNYSDEEIIGRIDWSDYPTLQRMDEGRRQGVPLTLNRAVGYSQDALYGTLWAARNDGGTGNAMADGVQAVLGQGNTWQEDADITARLDPTSDRYSPYSVGCTLDDAAVYFGVDSFGVDWLEQNRDMLAGNDQTARKMYAAVYDAEQTTLAAEAELTALNERIAKLAKAGSGTDAETILKRIDWSDYPTLARLDKSLKSGEIIATTRAIDYRKQDVEERVRQQCGAAAQTLSGQAFVDDTAAKLTAAPETPVTETEAAGEDATQYKQVTHPWYSFLPNVWQFTLDKVTEKTYTQPESREEVELPGGMAGELSGSRQRASGALVVTDVPYSSGDALSQARSSAIDAAAPTIEDMGTDAEKAVFETAYTANFDAHTQQMYDSIMGSTLPVADSFSVMQASVDDYAIQHYLKAAAIVKPYEAAEQKRNEAAAQHKALHDQLKALGYYFDEENNVVPLSGTDNENAAQAYALGEQLAPQITQLRREIAQQEQVMGNYSGSYNAASGVYHEIMADYESLALINEQTGAYDGEVTGTITLLDYIGQYGAEYQPTEWSAYSLYQAYLNEGTASYDEVALLAKVNRKTSQNELQRLEWVMQQAEERGIALPDSYRENIQREQARLEREISDADYFLLEQNADFAEVVSDRPELTMSEWLNTDSLEGLTVGDILRDPEANLGKAAQGTVNTILQRFVESGGLDIVNEGMSLLENLFDLKANTKEGHAYVIKAALSGMPDSAAKDFALALAELNQFSATDALDTLMVMDEMTEDEKDRLWYLYKTEGAASALDYVGHLTDETHGALLVRRSQEASETWAQIAKTLPVAGTAMSVVMNLNPESVMYSTYASLTPGAEVNPYHPAFSANNMVSTTRQTVKDTISTAVGDNETGNFLLQLGYDALTGAADSAVNMALYGPKYMGIAMGATAYSSAIQDAKLRGATDTQALQLGVAAFATEMGTEWLSGKAMDAAFKHALKNGAKGSVKTYLTTMAKESLEEFLGESASELAGSITDTMIMQELSNYNQAVLDYQAEGMSPEDAETAAMCDFIGDVIYSGVVGMASSTTTQTASYAAGKAVRASQGGQGAQTDAAASQEDAKTSQTVEESAQTVEESAQEENAAAESAAPAQLPDSIARPDAMAEDAIEAGDNVEGGALTEAAEASAEDGEELVIDAEIEPAESMLRGAKTGLPAAPAGSGLNTPLYLTDGSEGYIHRVTALTNALGTTDTASQTAAIAASLTTQGEQPVTIQEATTAAQQLSARMGGAKAVRFVRDVMTTGVPADANVSQKAVVRGLIAGSVDQNSAAGMAMVTMQETGVTPEGVIALAEAGQNAEAAVQTAMHETAVAQEVKNLIADGALSGLATYELSVEQAQGNLSIAQENLEQARQKLRAGQQNFQTISEQHLADPTNAAIRGAHQQATKDLTGLVTVVNQQDQAVQKRQAELQQARDTLKNATETTMKHTREQAMANVAQREAEAALAAEQAAQLAAQEAAQAEAAAEELRLNQNISAVEAEAFAAEMESKNPGMTEQQREQVKERYAAWLEEQQTSQQGDAASADNAGAVPASIRSATALMSRFNQVFGVRFQVTDGVMGNVSYRGAHTADGTILISRNATQDEVLRKTLIHELSHHAEGSRAYTKFADELLDIVYKGDKQQKQVDLDNIRERYRDAQGDGFTDQDAYTELVAAKAEEILGNEETIKRLTAEKPSIAARIWQTLKNFVKKITGVKSTEAERIRRAEELFRKALEEAWGKNTKQLQQMEKPKRMRFALQVDTAVDDATQYSYDHLTGQPDMVVTKMPNLQLYKKGKGADRVKAKTDGIRDADNIKSRVSSENKLFVDNLYTGTPLQINTAAIQHSITGSPDRQMRNAAAGAIVGQIASNAIPVNELIHQKTETQPWVHKEYLYLSLAEDDTFYYPIAMVVQATNEDLGSVTHIEAMEGIEKRYVYSVNAHQHKKEAGYEDMTAYSSSTSADSTISIAGFLDLVKDDFADGYSSDVLHHLGIIRPSGPFAGGTRFADPVVIPSTEVLNAQMAAFHERMANPPATPTNDAGQQRSQPRMGERQFTTQTLQNSPAVPDWIKRELYGNDYARFYEVETNRQQLEGAWTRIQQEGYDAAVNRLTHLDHIAYAWEEQELNIMMALALRPADMGGLGNFGMAMDLMLASAVQGTETGKALQARKQFAKMTPTQARRSVAEHSERDLHDHMQKNKRQREKVRRNAQQVADKLKGKQGGDELLRLNAAGSFTIDESNSRWGMPINEQQQALIDHYGLNNVRRPGVFYNRATTEQRMLEAILATPNPQELTGNGLTLIERLEYMQEGVAVITNADLEYIGQHLAQFASYDVDTQRGREGDLALARAYEAYGNITPASAREKARTWRYTSMLLSVPSAIRNVIGNAGQNIANATAHGIAVELDRIVSLATGQRTMAHLSMQERANGWHSFVEETQNTFRDFFVDRAVTQRGDDRFNTNQRGRVFQNAAAEAMRNLEGYLMSVGDRNFWRKSFVNSMAEQQRVAEVNGTALDYDAAVEQATQDANYATFNEDSAVRTALNGLKQVRGWGDMLDFIMPFTGVPTNIVKRMWQFSPGGLASTSIYHAWRHFAGKDFNQRDFVNGMARGLTGTALFAIGMALYAAGHIKLGTGEEEDEKAYGVQTALGDQYAPYIEVLGQNISLSAFAPGTTPIIMGATAADLFEEDTEPWNALYNAALSGFDQILDASYMSNLSDIFGGYGSVAENIGSTVLESAVSQNIPSILSQIASALDPYVRDTKEKDVVLAMLKTAMNKIPGVRQLLPEKVDVAGRSVVNTDHGAAAFIDPFNRTIADDDPALQELDRLYKALGTSAHLPSDALSGTKTALSGVAAPVEGEDKETYKKRYGELWRLGGITFDRYGNEVVVTGVTDLIQTKAYQQMTDAEKAIAISGIMSAAKAGAAYEMGEKLGHTRTEEAEDTGYTKQAIRPMPARYANMDSEDFRMLASKFEETGDGAFIPKDIGGSFTRNKVQYDLTGEEYAELQALYDIELEAQLSQIDWYVSDEELAAAVNAAYSKAASDAKDEYVKKLP